MKESLHIGEHIKILVLKALNKTRITTDAAVLLGISACTLRRYKNQFDIIYDNGFFISKSNKLPPKFKIYYSRKKAA